MKDGFTIFELLVTLGVTGIILAMILPVSINFYRSYRLDYERLTLASVLERARSYSMINLNQSAHGIYIGSAAYTIYQGTNYAGRTASQDKDFSRDDSITITGPTEINFAALSGQTASSSFTLSNGFNSFIINVNSEGTISY